jgi:shikimate dehydrogenase
MPAELKRSCVIGWPVEHSRSPLIHNYWLKHYGLAGEYSKEAVAPEALVEFLQTLQERGYVGCNVTIPHKERTAELVVKADALSRRTGAVNTIYVENAILMGANTDGFGFTENLKACSPDLKLSGSTAMIFGAGGAAKAVLAALLDLGAGRIVLCNRSLSRAQALARSFGPSVQTRDWSAASDAMEDVSLLVNATSLGMAGKPELEISLDALPKKAVVYDIVYVPLETTLLRRARARGHPTVDGLGMLLHQARPGFEKWFGLAPEVTPELRRRVEQHILGAA